MQKITFQNPEDTVPANKWFHSRRNYHVRKLYSLFFRAYADFFQEYHDFLQDNHKTGSPCKPEEQSEKRLRQLKELSHNLFNGNHFEQHGQHLNWAIHSLYHTALKQRENKRISEFHYQTKEQHPEYKDPGHTAYIEEIRKETTGQFKTLEMLFNNARDLLRFLLIDQSGNDLLLRLLIEKEFAVQKLWQTSTLDLFAEMFPYQPEAGYIQAGKSYFMGQWLEDALDTYEKSLAINSDLSEPRRQTYLIRAMIKDRKA